MGVNRESVEGLLEGRGAELVVSVEEQEGGGVEEDLEKAGMAVKVVRALMEDSGGDLVQAVDEED